MKIRIYLKHNIPMVFVKGDIYPNMGEECKNQKVSFGMSVFEGTVINMDTNGYEIIVTKARAEGWCQFQEFTSISLQIPFGNIAATQVLK